MRKEMVSFRCPAGLARRLREVAVTRGETVTEVLIRQLREGLQRTGDRPEKLEGAA